MIDLELKEVGVVSEAEAEAVKATKELSAKAKRELGDLLTGHKRPSPKTRTRKPRKPEPDYHGLEGDWLDFYEVADRYCSKAKVEDRADLRHDIILRLAQVARTKSVTRLAMYRVASYVVADYWRAQYKFTNGLDCGSCSKIQRLKCRAEDLYRECPKAIKLESLSKPIVDDDGNTTELGELIADDSAIDLDAWLDTNTFIAGCPKRLIAIAEKRREGIPLNEVDQRYFTRQRQKELKRYQKALF